MKIVVIDANLVISILIPLPYSVLAVKKMVEWQSDRARLVVPVLWHYEVLTGLRKAVSQGALSEDAVGAALEKFKNIASEEQPPGFANDRGILTWASRIGQIVAYDAVYLDLSEALGAEFWTADKPLARAAQKAGADWAHWLGDAES